MLLIISLTLLQILGSVVWLLYALVDDVKLKKHHNASEVYDLFSSSNDINRYILLVMNDIHKKLTNVDRAVQPKIITDSLAPISHDIMLKKNLDTVELSVQSIDDAYNEFHQKMDRQNPHTGDILEELTRRVIVKVEGKIEVIRKILIDGEEFLADNQTLLSAVSEEALKRKDLLCDNPRTVASTLIQLFKMTIIAEIKVNVMLIFVNTYRYSDNDGWKMINALAREQFEKQFANYTLVFHEYISKMQSVYLRRCIPYLMRDETYTELEGAVQATIFSYNREVGGEYTCEYMRLHCVDECSVKIDNRTGCSGVSSWCFGLGAIDACVLKEGTRRFEYIKGTLATFGQNFNCPEDNGYHITSNNTKNEYCACNCNRNHFKISVLQIDAWWRCNRVITGLRIVRRDNTLHLQVREGQLLAYGAIVPVHENHGWMGLPSPNEHRIYETLDHTNNRFFLDDLRLPHNYVLMGVKFFKTVRGSKTGFAIEIYGLEFSYKTGLMNGIYKNPLKVNHETDNPGKELIFSKISSEQTNLPHKVSSEEFGYVTIQRSDLTNNFGQTTVPLFDIIPVTTSPPTLLGGVGLFHKGLDGFAGFLSLRLYPIVYEEYFNNFNKQKVNNGTVIFNLTDIDEDSDYPWIEFNKIYTQGANRWSRMQKLATLPPQIYYP